MDWFYLVLAIFLVLLNGFFVATEFAIVKVRPTRIEELIQAGRPGAVAVRRLVVNIDGYLAATQFGITLASLGLGWLGEPAFTRLIEPVFTAWGLSEAWLHPVSAAIAFGIITFLHIVVGELAPKSMAILRAEAVAMTVAYPMRAIYFIFYPAIWALNGMANQMLRWFGLRPVGHESGGHTEDEIKIILAQARSAGLLTAARADLVSKAMGLPTKAARHLMVPRNEVVLLDVNLDATENLERARTSGHSRFPLANRELDEVIGIVDIREVLFEVRRRGGDADIDIVQFAQPATYFPEMMTGERLLAEFRTRRVQMAVIVDEYGGASGIVTPNDVVTVVMGELDDDDDEADMIPLPGGAYDVEGTAPLEEVEEALRTRIESQDMRTVAGFLMERLGRMPRIGDRVFAGGFSFNVLDVSGPRVRKVRIQREGAPGPRPPRPPE